MKRSVLLCLCAALGACSGGEHEDLTQWMENSAKDMRGNIAKLPEVKPYESVPYEVQGLIDPFKSSRIEPESKSKQGNGKGQPDFEAREIRNSPLEKQALESLKMIGYMNINKQPIAVIQYEDKVKQVKKGDYIGLDFGLITEITEKEIKLRELVQNPDGNWEERNERSLSLQNKEGIK